MKKKGKEFRNLRLSSCKSARSLPPFGAAKNDHATLTFYRCSSTCWHLKTPALAQIHHRTKKPKTTSLFNHLNSSRASWLSWKLCDFGSSGTRLPPWSTLYFCVTFFSKVRTAKNFKVFHMYGDGLRTCVAEKSIKTSQQVFIWFKNLPAGYYRDLQTSGQSMSSNGRLAIETSIKNLIIKQIHTYTSNIFLATKYVAGVRVGLLDDYDFPPRTIIEKI